MSIRWERLAGDTSTFAFKVAFSPDPDDGQGIDPDLAVSWGGFQLWVEGKNLCAHQEEGERTEYVHWYLLPLVEWFACQWNPLLHEERLPARNAADTAWASLRETCFPPAAIELEEGQANAWESAWQGWWRRHAIRAGREGGLFPDVILRRFRDEIELSWGNHRIQGMPNHFAFDAAESGFARFRPREVAAPLHDLLSGVGQYLASLAPESERIKTLNRGIRALETPQREERLGWLAGLGVDERAVRQGWKRVKRHLAERPKTHQRSMLGASGRSKLVVEGACHAALMFGTVAPAIRKEDVLQLADAMIEFHLPTDQACTARISSMCRVVPVDDSGGPPWSQGYRLAEELHEELEDAFVAEDFVDVDRLLASLGVQVVDVNLTDEAIRAVAIAGPRYHPGIACNGRNRFNDHSYGRRFTLAHELCHLLFDRSTGQRLAIASGPWAPVAIDRRANAFAAMFLMPTEIVQRAISARNAPLERQADVAAVARHMNTGFEATLSHLKNLGFIDETAEQRIAAERHSHIH